MGFESLLVNSEIFNSAFFPLVFTAKVAMVTLTLHAIFGLAIGYYLGRKSSPSRTVIDAAVTVPLVFPPIALGFLLLLVLGKAGFMGRLLDGVLGVEIIFNFWGVVLAAFIAGLPLIVKPVQAAVQSTAVSLMEASYTLGACRPED